MRRARHNDCDEFSKDCDTVLYQQPKLSELVSQIVPDRDRLYAMLADGSVVKMAQPGGELQVLEPGQARSPESRERQPLIQCLASADSSIYYIDFAQGTVVRHDKASSNRQVIVSDMHLPLAIALQRESLFVLAGSDNSNQMRHQRPFTLFEFNSSNSSLIRRVELPERDPTDMVATQQSVYIAFSRGALLKVDTKSRRGRICNPNRTGSRTDRKLPNARSRSRRTCRDRPYPVLCHRRSSPHVE